MKKSVVLVLALFIFGIGLVTAADCSIELGPVCPSGEIVPGFWFSNNVNAHGSIYDIAGYDHIVCCDAGLNISFFSGSNDVVRISDQFNAHFGTLGGSSYPFILKLQNATCRDSASCVGDEFCLFSLALQTNSHASECGTPGYNIDICCNSTLVGGPTLGDCGDGIIDTPNINGLNEECEGSNLDGENCTSLGWDDGTLSCNSDECTFNTSGCFNVVTNQPPVVGPSEYYVYGECLDDGDGDEYGEANWTIYAGDGSSTDNGTIMCQLGTEEVSFWSNFSVLMFLTILVIFYIYNYLRRCDNNANCN